MGQLEKIHNEWLNDCVIDEDALDQTGMKVPLLHAKWLQIYTMCRQELRSQEIIYEDLYNKRMNWYDGLLSKEQMDELEWPYDPYNGHLVKTKAHRTEYIKRDSVLLNASKMVDDASICVDTVKEIIDSIRWRTQNIKVILDAKKFNAGL